MTTKRKRKGLPTARIYKGPDGAEMSSWWTVKVSDAKQLVRVDGNVIHALRGHPGKTIGCGLSNAAIDKANVKAFPHPVLLCSVTKSTLYIVDKLKKNGDPAHAVRYGHNYGWITERNDDKTLKALVKADPALMERPFVFRPPRRARAGVHRPADAGRVRCVSDNRTHVTRGALARAVKAGLIGAHVADQLTEVAKAKTT